MQYKKIKTLKIENVKNFNLNFKKNVNVKA